MPALPSAFLRRPLAHRALHGPGAPENSRAAVRRAIDAGYGIEIDLQLSSDGVPMVFHDYDLRRLTADTGPVAQHSAEALAGIPLTGGDEGIPTLDDILALVAGRVPLLIELKDQDGIMGDRVGRLEAATARTLDSYDGPVAVMSFNPHSVAEMARLAPGVPRGLTTSAYDADNWQTLPARVRDHLRTIPDYARTGASFISHEAADLDRPRVAEIKAQGAAILCWTIRSAEAEATARRVADNITFEGYDA
ncbi:glycerophosphodiester phosphodiesterase family protein [Thalassococcus sp. BH17M4-6]|uniref:glycerophosphodiester phosphodiesterase family protein n=1 Tax=Thalassococcus sp. BH17M4-6 TaxID=3413148 RepID=UPI003BC9115A